MGVSGGARHMLRGVWERRWLPVRSGDKCRESEHGDKEGAGKRRGAGCGRATYMWGEENQRTTQSLDLRTAPTEALMPEMRKVGGE